MRQSQFLMLKPASPNASPAYLRAQAMRKDRRTRAPMKETSSPVTENAEVELDNRPYSHPAIQIGEILLGHDRVYVRHAHDRRSDGSCIPISTCRAETSGAACFDLPGAYSQNATDVNLLPERNPQAVDHGYRHGENDQIREYVDGRVNDGYGVQAGVAIAVGVAGSAVQDDKADGVHADEDADAAHGLFEKPARVHPVVEREHGELDQHRLEEIRHRDHPQACVKVHELLRCRLPDMPAPAVRECCRYVSTLERGNSACPLRTAAAAAAATHHNVPNTVAKK